MSSREASEVNRDEYLTDWDAVHIQLKDLMEDYIYTQVGRHIRYQVYINILNHVRIAIIIRVGDRGFNLIRAELNDRQKFIRTRLA